MPALRDGVCAVSGVRLRVDWCSGEAERMHKRTAFSRFGRCGAASIGATWVQLEAKHKYLYPLDDVMREQIDALRVPYPKRAGGADSGTPESQPEGALQYDPGALGNTTVR